MDLIESVKRLDIVGYIERETGNKSKKIGSTRRVNPCPFCHHNDSFTIYPSDNSFNCFSGDCQRGGSIIDFEILMHGIEDPLEAAKSIAKKAGISLDGKEKAPDKKKRKKTPEEELPSIDTDRANELRGLVADFYHDQFINNDEALSYQTDTRGHSIEILKELKVGYAGKKSLIASMQKAGFEVDDLMACGLVKKKGRGYGSFIWEGHFVYPHFVDGACLHFTVKDPKSGKPYQTYKKCAGSNWFCYGQDALAGPGPVVIVEGENDFIAVRDAGWKSVIATNGQSNAPAILDFLKTNSKDKTFYLCFDKDSGGKGYEERFPRTITEARGEARIMDFPVSPPDKDIDDFLRSSDNPKKDFDDLMSKARIWTEAQGKGNGDGTAPEDPYHFDSFGVLGELEDNRLVFESHDIQKLYILPVRDLTLENLVQIGGEEVNYRVCRTIEAAKEEGKIHLYDLRKKIILKARTRQLGPLRYYGQGVNFLEDGTLLIVNGSSSFKYDGKNFDPYNSAMIENRLISKRDAARWINFDEVMKTISSLTIERIREIIGQAIHLFQQWRFCGDYSQLIVTGFLFAQMVQSLWDWRPHLWLSGPAGSGKTLLINLFEEIGGALSRRFEGNSTSEAGFRQSLKHDFGLAFIDEFERSEARDQIIAYLRTAGRGGPVIKGSPGQEAIAFELRHMVLVGSIETALVRAAEKTRFLAVELFKDPSRNPQIPDVREMEKLRMDFFAYALWASFRAKALVKDHSRMAGYDPRLCEAFGVPLAMIAAAELDPIKVFQKYLLMLLNEIQSSGGGEELEEDEIRLLSDILNTTIRVESSEGGEFHNIYGERSISWLLNSFSDLHQRDAEAHGIKKCDDGVFMASDIIGRKLLKDTFWRGMNISGILKRLPGAMITRRRINKASVRGVLIPFLPDFFGETEKETISKAGDGDLFR